MTNHPALGTPTRSPIKFRRGLRSRAPRCYRLSLLACAAHPCQDHGSRDRRQKDGTKALAANPNPEWTEHEMHSIDEWIAHQDVKIERSEAIRRLVEIGLKVKGK
jgi:hypothetical protein